MKQLVKQVKVEKALHLDQEWMKLILAESLVTIKIKLKLLN